MSAFVRLVSFIVIFLIIILITLTTALCSEIIANVAAIITATFDGKAALRVHIKLVVFVFIAFVILLFFSSAHLPFVMISYRTVSLI